MSQSNVELNNLNGNTHQLVINSLAKVSFKTKRLRLPGFSFLETGVDFPNQQFNIPGMKFRPDPVVATFIVDEDMTNYFECLKWLVRCRYYDETELLSTVLEDFTINIFDNHQKSSVSFRFTGGFIQSLDGLDLDTGSSEPATCTATLLFQNMEVDQYRGQDAVNIVGLKL
jgi:hypothetical protein